MGRDGRDGRDVLRWITLFCDTSPSDHTTRVAALLDLVEHPSKGIFLLTDISQAACYPKYRLDHIHPPPGRHPDRLEHKSTTATTTEHHT